MTYPLEMTLDLVLSRFNEILFSVLEVHVLILHECSRLVLAGTATCTQCPRPLPHAKRSSSFWVAPAARAQDNIAAQALQRLGRNPSEKKGFGSLPKIPGARGARGASRLLIDGSPIPSSQSPGLLSHLIFADNTQ
jgi:hypothetical protein